MKKTLISLLMSTLILAGCTSSPHRLILSEKISKPRIEVYWGYEGTNTFFEKVVCELDKNGKQTRKYASPIYPEQRVENLEDITRDEK